MLRSPPKAPERLKEDILNQLHSDSRVDETHIQVEIEGNKAVLTGIVTSLAARKAAEADASIIPGIDLVDNRLRVRYPEHPGMPGDKEIRARIEDSLLWNSSIDTSKIKVTVKGGIVFIEGTVSSYWQKFKVQDIAEETAGTIDVDNALSVEPQERYQDDLITEEVFSALTTNLRLDAKSLEVLVENGVVTLMGNVPDLSSYRAAESIASFIEGVIAVKNDLTIEPDYRT